MAITPTQALGNKPVLELRLIDELEAEIDAYLEINWHGQSCLNVEINRGSQYVRNTLVQKYTAAGWIVTPVNSMRNEIEHNYTFRVLDGGK